jgi:RNA polymerase sigma-70 factor (ECF subfamily)
LEEDEALARLKQGDITALEELVRRYSVRALRTAFLITRDRSSAEDIVQSAFLRVFERRDQFQTGRPFEPWLLRIVINDALKLARPIAPLPLDGMSGGGEQLLPSPEPPPDEQLIAKETTEAIWHTLGRLSATQRAVIVMRYYLGMNEEEMAEELDCAPGTVKSRLHAARQRMRQLLPSEIR